MISEAILDPANGNWVVRSIKDAKRDNGIWTVDSISVEVTAANRHVTLREDQIRRGGC